MLNRRKGFTLVELLVVIAIIGVLVALLLPAVQAAREAARRSQCSNNLKQLGLGLHNYLDANSRFPFGGSYHAVGGLPNSTGPGAISWRTAILPFIEQATLYDQIKLTVKPLFLNQTAAPPSAWLTAFRSLPAHQVIIGSYSCPSDPLASQLHAFPKYWLYAPENVPTAVACYWGSAGASSVGAECGLCSNPAACKCLNIGDYAASGAPDGGSGMFAMRATCIKLKQVSDGTSHTLLVGEERLSPDTAGKLDNTPTVHWMEPYSLGSSIWGINGPNDPATVGAAHQGWGSYHTGGAHFAFADGSVQFLNDMIDMMVLSNLATRNGGELSGDF